MNLGSPDSTEVKDVRNYLHEFLMDKRVIDYPWLFRKILVDGIIIGPRAPKSAEAYRSVWLPEGSPLIVLTKKLQLALQAEMDCPIEVAMRYGNPTMKGAYDRLMTEHPDLTEVILVPLYPHYAMSSYETAVEYAREIHKKYKYPFRIKTLLPFYEDPLYIGALAQSMKPYVDEKRYDHVLFSYHGLPQRHLTKADVTGNHCLRSDDCCSVDSVAHKHCYRHQVYTTTRKTAQLLDIPSGKYSVSFQSRLGREQWIRPYTVDELVALPARGVKRLLVVCPAFVSDCLETLEEMGIQGKEIFLAAGGESFTLIPCMNTQPGWVGVLASWLKTIQQGDTSLIANL